MRSQEKAFTAVGTIMALALLWAAGQPGTGQIFPGTWHYMAHFMTFAVLGAVWALGLPRIPALAAVAGVVAFGFVHEGCEISGHVHGFELYDAIVDGVGAIVGTLSVRFARLAITSM